ncbi:MAG TPA: diaminopimelate epimerase [Patescibacteria group bacterium]|nr:diaminopimelate epimerase [Patescibacteria group bacterium]
MQFTKWQGLGNDFILIDGFKTTIHDYTQAAIAMCDRHFGIGADGLVTIFPSKIADFEMQIINSDGSEAAMCGNATRCVARYLYENGFTDKTVISLETKAGLIRPELIFDGSRIISVRVDMGEPRLEQCHIPMTGDSEKHCINQPLTVQNQQYFITAVSMGNPHCVIFVDDVQAIDLSDIGPLLENHSCFPDKANIEFAQIIDENTIKMRVWERGAGITLACGTGSCATLVASVLNHKTKRQATLQLAGGELFIEWASNNHLYMTGPAKEVFRGTWL